MNFRNYTKFTRLFIFVIFVTILQYGVASEFIVFEDGRQPHFENEDYEVWLMSVLNEKDNAYVNLSILPKKRFRHRTYYKLKKSDRTDIASAWELKLIESDSTKVIGILPFVSLEKGRANQFKKPDFYDNGVIETSANLEDKTINYVCLKFGGHISPDTKRISLIQNGNDRFFSFIDIPLSFSRHNGWECKYKDETELMALIDSSNDPISGIYEQDGIRYACILDGNTYNLIRLEDSPDLIWRFGDIRASFNRTAITGVSKDIIVIFIQKSVRMTALLFGMEIFLKL